MDIDKIKGLVKKLKYRLLNKGLENIISELRTEIKGLSYGVFDELRDILTDICNIIEDINIFDYNDLQNRIEENDDDWNNPIDIEKELNYDEEKEDNKLIWGY